MGVTVYDKLETATAKQRTPFAVLRRQRDVFLKTTQECQADDGDHTVVDLITNSGSHDSQTRTSTKKKVSFGELHIREYAVILGDHPCCTVGLPLTLGWGVQGEASVGVDEHEALRTARSRRELKLSLYDRHSMLSSSYSEEELRREQRKLHRARQCGQHQRAKKRFFAPTSTLIEV